MAVRRDPTGYGLTLENEKNIRRAQTTAATAIEKDTDQIMDRLIRTRACRAVRRPARRHTLFYYYL